MSTRLYVGNLSFQATADDVRDAFAQHGEVTDVHVVTDRETGRARGFAFVTMGTPEQAQAAIEAMNGAMMDGRPLRVNEAEARPQRGGGGGGGGFGGGGGGRGGFGGGAPTRGMSRTARTPWCWSGPRRGGVAANRLVREARSPSRCQRSRPGHG